MDSGKGVLKKKVDKNFLAKFVDTVKETKKVHHPSETNDPILPGHLLSSFIYYGAKEYLEMVALEKKIKAMNISFKKESRPFEELIFNFAYMRKYDNLIATAYRGKEKIIGSTIELSDKVNQIENNFNLPEKNGYELKYSPYDDDLSGFRANIFSQLLTNSTKNGHYSPEMFLVAISSYMLRKAKENPKQFLENKFDRKAVLRLMGDKSEDFRYKSFRIEFWNNTTNLNSAQIYYLIEEIKMNSIGPLIKLGAHSDKYAIFSMDLQLYELQDVQGAVMPVLEDSHQKEISIP